MRHSSPLKKAIASALAAALFGNAALLEAAQATLWSDRRPVSVPAPAVPAPLPLGRPAADASRSPLERALLALPLDLGTVRAVAEPSGASRGVLVAINDVHGNAEAQENIRRAVESLASAGFDQLALEGAAGPIDLGPLRRTVPRADLRALARYLTAGDVISGPAAAALAGDRDITTFGIDDAALHRANAEAYLRSRPLTGALRRALDAASADVLARQRAAFPPALREADALIRSFHAGTASLGTTLARLAAISGRTPSANANRFLAALALEASMDKPAVERERARVLERVAAHADRAALTDLLSRTAALRAGRETPAAYHAALRTLCARLGVSTDDLPAFNAYVRYAALSDAVDPAALLQEQAGLERAACARLATTPALTALVNEGRWYMLAAKLSDFSLTRDEWTDLATLPRPRGAPSRELTAPCEDFYRCAEARDAALAENTLRAMAPRGGAVVAGGFHGDALRRTLADAGWTVIDFTPRLTHADGGSGYLTVFAQEKTPLERLFAGEKLFLKSDPLPAAVREGLVPGAALALRALDGTTGGETGFVTSAAPEAGIVSASAEVTGREAAEATIARGNGAVEVDVKRKNGAITRVSQHAVSPFRFSIAETLRSFRRLNTHESAVALSLALGAVILGAGGFSHSAFGVFFVFAISAVVVTNFTGEGDGNPDDRPVLLADGRVFRAEGEGVPLPTRLELSRTALGLRADEIAARVLDAAARRLKDGVSHAGRSLTVDLPADRPLVIDGRSYSRLVIKRATYRGGLPEARAYEPGADEVMQQPTVVVRSGPDGRAWWEPAPVAIVGTGTLADNVIEYRRMLQAQRAGVPTARPIGIGQFTELTFNGEPTAFLVYADNPGERTGEVYRVRRAALTGAASMEAADAFMRAMVTDLLPEIEAAARTLRRLHDAGITHSHPHLFQFTLAQDGVSRVYDLDSARLADGMSREEFSYACLRDLLYLHASIDNVILGSLNPELREFVYQMMLPALGVRDPFDVLLRAYFRPEEQTDHLARHFSAPAVNLGRNLVPRSGNSYADVSPELRAYFDRTAGEVHDDILRAALRRRVDETRVDALLPALRTAQRAAIESGTVSRETAAALVPGAQPADGAILADVANELAARRDGARTPVLFLPLVRSMAALTYAFVRALRGHPVSLMAAMVAVERASLRTWFRSVLVPVVELPGLPGIGLAVLAFLPGGTVFAVPLAALIAGTVFAALHGRPGATGDQSWSAFQIRALASTGIHLASLSLYAGVGGVAGLALAAAVAVALHGLWNAAAPERWELAAGGWKRRLTRLLKAVNGDRPDDAVADIGDMLSDDFKKDTAGRASAWAKITRALGTMNMASREVLAEAVLEDVLDAIARRSDQSSALHALEVLLNASETLGLAEMTWNLVIERARGGSATLRQSLIPEAIRIAIARASLDSSRLAAISDIQDLVVIRTDARTRARVRDVLHSALRRAPAEMAETIPNFLLSLARRAPDDPGEAVRVYKLLMDAALDPALPQEVRVQSVLHAELLAGDQRVAGSRERLVRDLRALLKTKPGAEVALPAVAAFEMVLRTPGMSDLLRRDAAAGILDSLSEIASGLALDRISALDPHYRRFRDPMDRRVLLRTVIESLPGWEGSFARRPEVLAAIGSMLARWLYEFPDDAHGFELAAIADHVVRTYPLVGRLYGPLAAVLVDLKVLPPIEAVDRLPWAHWDLDPERLERDPIVEELDDRKIEVLGRLDILTPGVSVVQRPVLRLQFAQTGDPTAETWNERLPLHENVLDVVGSTVYEDGRALTYYPAKLIGGGQTIEFMALLGERVSEQRQRPGHAPRIRENIREKSDVTYDETNTHGRAAIRAWVPWKVGGLYFRRPGMALENHLWWRDTVRPEPRIFPLGHSHDLRTAYYMFAETGIVYSLELRNDERLHRLREIASVRNGNGGPVGIETNQEIYAARERAIADLLRQVDDLDAYLHERYVVSLTEDNLPDFYNNLASRNPGLTSMIFGNVEPLGLRPADVSDRVRHFLSTRHAADGLLIADLSAAYADVTGGYFAPSLNLTFSDEGVIWLAERFGKMTELPGFRPIPAELNHTLERLRGDVVDIEDGADDMFPDALYVFDWVGESLAYTRRLNNVFERLLLTGLEQEESVLGFFTRLDLSHNQASLVVDTTNLAESQYLGEVYGLALPILDAHVRELAPQPTYVQVTVPNREQRKVFAGNAGDERTVGEVLDSVKHAVPSRADVLSITLRSPGAADRVVGLNDRVVSGDSLVVTLKSKASRTAGHLDVLGNIAPAALFTLAVAFALAAVQAGGSLALFAFYGAQHAAVALGATLVAVVVHEAWHIVLAWIATRFEGHGSAVTVSAGKRLDVRADIRSPLFRAISGVAAVTAVPLMIALGRLELAPALAFVAGSAIVFVNALSLVPLGALTARFLPPAAARRMALETDGDLLLALLAPRQKSPPALPATPEERLAARVADAAVQLRSAAPDHAAIAAQMSAIASEVPLVLGVDGIAGRAAAVTGQSAFIDEGAYAAALADAYRARGLSTDADAVRADLQGLSRGVERPLDLDFALARTDARSRNLNERQGNVAILSPTLKAAEESRLVDLLLARASTLGMPAVLITADPKQRDRLLWLTNGRATVILSAAAFGVRDGRSTVEMAAAVRDMEAAGVRLNEFSSVRFIAPADRVIVMDGLSDDLPWLRRAALVLIDDALRAAEGSVPALQDIERLALLVSRQA